MCQYYCDDAIVPWHILYNNKSDESTHVKQWTNVPTTCSLKLGLCAPSTGTEVFGWASTSISECVGKSWTVEPEPGAVAPIGEGWKNDS